MGWESAKSSTQILKDRKSCETCFAVSSDEDRVFSGSVDDFAGGMRPLELVNIIKFPMIVT